MESKSVDTGSHCYINISKPFKFGERMVQWATEMLSVIDSETAITRRVLLDVQTGKEINGPYDLGSHVIRPEPGGAYHIQQVVDALPGKPEENENENHFHKALRRLP